jgi:hypothetical protein
MADAKLTHDDPAQSQRFIDMAREVEADGDLEKFDKLFIKTAPLPPDRTPKAS